MVSLSSSLAIPGLASMSKAYVAAISRTFVMLFVYAITSGCLSIAMFSDLSSLRAIYRGETLLIQFSGLFKRSAQQHYR